MKIELFSRIVRHRTNYYFRIVARNGRTVAASEGYLSRQARARTVRSIILNVFTAELVEVSK